MAKISVVLADEHDFLRFCIKNLLETNLSLRVVAEVSLLDKAEEQLGRVPADMIILHSPLPGGDTVQIVQQIRSRFPKLFVFLLTHYPQTGFLKQFFDNSVHGLFGCGSTVQDLWKRIEQLAHPPSPRNSRPKRPGKAGANNPSWFEPAVIPALNDRNARFQMDRTSGRGRSRNNRKRKSTRLPDGRDPLKIAAELTAREKEVLTLIADTFVNRQIAERLNISVRTVENHRASIKRKTGLANTAGLVRLALSAGITHHH